jgi:formylglycine-generating enzyme required for sulfatase activity
VPLESLAISAGTLFPTFATEVTSYSAAVAYANASLTVTPTAGDARSTITVDDVTVVSGSASQAVSLQEGRTEIEIIVTAVDGKTTKTYALSVDRQGAHAGEWVTIPPTGTVPATFMMGSPVGEFGRNNDNEIQHEVTLTNKFEILSTEVTQTEYMDLMIANPSYFKLPDHPSCLTCPVERVTWHEAAAYCNALSVNHLGGPLAECYTSRDGGMTYELNTPYATPYACPGYRLPTEAEWEYAARAGTDTATYNGDFDETEASYRAVLDPIAWYASNSGGTTHQVATRDVNAWGLYDMLGNVWEWCHDWYGSYPTTPSPLENPWGPDVGSGRVGRGGSWDDDAGVARAARRGNGDPGGRYDNLGFRPVRSLP